MAMTQQERSAKTATKRKEVQEEELRLRVRPGTKQALLELMAWAGIEEQGEAMTLMIHHLHGLGPGGALPLLEPPRHEITVSPKMSATLSVVRQPRAIEQDNAQPRKYLARALQMIGHEL